MKKYINEELISNFIKNNKLTKTKFCKISKISLKTFYKVLDGNYNVDVKVLFKIAKAMQKNIVDILIKWLSTNRHNKNF